MRRETTAGAIPDIEQDGSSLYASLIPKATALVVLRILYAIGGSEVAHFQTWSDKAGAAVSPPLAPLRDNGLTFHDLNSPPFGGEAFSTNLIMPEPCDFISESLPDCAIIRPTLAKNAGPLAVVTFLTNQGFFTGQSAEFFKTLQAIARAADRADVNWRKRKEKRAWRFKERKWVSSGSLHMARFRDVCVRLELFSSERPNSSNKEFFGTVIPANR